MLLDFNYKDIINQCNTMCYLNVLSYSVLSGCGNIQFPNDIESSKIKSFMEKLKEDVKVKNIFFMPSIYRQCTPIYSHVPTTFYDFTEFQWVRKKTKKIIKPCILAYSIYCLSRLSQKISNEEISVENKNLIYYCLLNNAIKQTEFMRQYLKIGDLYYGGEDMGDDSYSEYNIELNPDDADILSQFLVIESFMELYNNVIASDYFESTSLNDIETEFNIIPTLCDNVISNLNIMKSRHISLICLSLVNIYKSSTVYKDVIYDTLNIIGCELKERMHDNGDISRSILDREASSFTTMCNCMNCFHKLYAVNNLDTYKQAGDRLYVRINSFWNNTIGLFIKSDVKKASYSIKDIAYIINSLNSRKNSSNDLLTQQKLEKQISSFYRSAIINSKIFSSQLYPILQTIKMDLHNFGSMNKNVPPVFLKSFDIKISKRKYYTNVDIYKPDYVLCACKHLLI